LQLGGSFGTRHFPRLREGVSMISMAVFSGTQTWFTSQLCTANETYQSFDSVRFARERPAPRRPALLLLRRRTAAPASAGLRNHTSHATRSVEDAVIAQGGDAQVEIRPDGPIFSGAMWKACSMAHAMAGLRTHDAEGCGCHSSALYPPRTPSLHQPFAKQRCLVPGLSLSPSRSRSRSRCHS
jgi:hypothetical protein